MKGCLLIILAIVLLIAIVYGLSEISPLLSETIKVDAPPAEGFDILFRLFGWKK